MRRQEALKTSFPKGGREKRRKERSRRSWHSLGQKRGIGPPRQVPWDTKGPEADCLLER